MEEVLYCIKINNRSLLWCDECWYETGAGLNYVFQKDTIDQVVTWMYKHYVYHVDVLGTDGSNIHYDFGKVALYQPSEYPERIYSEFELDLF